MVTFSFLLHYRGPREKEDGIYEGGLRKKGKENRREHDDYCEDGRRLIPRNRQKDVQKLRSFCSVQAGGNTIPKDPMNGKEYAGSRGADLGYGNVGASNAVKACRNGHMKGGKGASWGEKGEGGNRDENGVEPARDSDVQMIDGRDVVILD